MVRIKDVALLAKVSTATVSHVVNGTRFVAEETKRRVYSVMKELNYQPNSVARSLRSRKSNIIGLLIPILPSDTSNFFFLSVAQGIETVLKQNGYHLIFSNSNENVATEMDQIRLFNSQLIDGLIMAPTYEEHEYLNDILTGDYPVVFIDRKPKDFLSDCILSDGKKGTYEAVHLLLEKGHKRIGFITGSLGLTTSDERLEGYKSAIAEFEIGVDEKLIKVSESSISTFEGGYQLTKELITECGVTALFVANNLMTMGALKYMQEEHIQIPEQVAIIGFDDYEWARITTPPLTVIKQPSIELGILAAQTILKRIKYPESEYEEIRLATELIYRSSC